MGLGPALPYPRSEEAPGTLPPAPCRPPRLLGPAHRGRSSRLTPQSRQGSPFLQLPEKPGSVLPTSLLGAGERNAKAPCSPGPLLGARPCSRAGTARCRVQCHWEVACRVINELHLAHEFSHPLPTRVHQEGPCAPDQVPRALALTSPQCHTRAGRDWAPVWEFRRQCAWLFH